MLVAPTPGQWNVYLLETGFAFWDYSNYNFALVIYSGLGLGDVYTLSLFISLLCNPGTDELNILPLFVSYLFI